MNNNRPLADCTILDCSSLLPGALMGKLLLDKGARIIKIEKPSQPDGARWINTQYEWLNSRKEKCVIDLKSKEGQQKLFELVKQANGLIEGFLPAVKQKLNLDEDSLHSINPKLCIVSLVGYPEDDERKDRAGHDLNFQAVTGMLSLFEGLPALPMANLFSAYAGALAMTSALAGVLNGTGKGSRSVISMSEVLKEVQGPYIHEYIQTGTVPKYGKTFVTGLKPCYRIYKSQDGKGIAVGAIEEKFWNRICDILELPELHGKGLEEGPEAKDIMAQVEKAFASKPWEHWEPIFDKANCCVERIKDYGELYTQ